MSYSYLFKYIIIGDTGKKPPLPFVGTTGIKTALSVSDFALLIL